MHGTFRTILTSFSADPRDGWQPYIPSFLTNREVNRQLGHKPTLYVMRKRDGRRWLYRACTPSESSVIEARDAGRA